MYAKCVLGLSVSGRENIPKKGGFILASNHVSNLDPVIVGVSCARKLNYMAKQELFANFYFGRLLYAVGAFPVKRSIGDISALKEAIKRVASGKGLLLFPEGGRRNQAEELKPQAGVGFLAVKTGVPVIPAFVRGTEIALPKGAKRIKPVKVSVCFGKKIFPDKNMSYQEITQVVMDNIMQLAS